MAKRKPKAPTGAPSPDDLDFRELVIRPPVMTPTDRMVPTEWNTNEQDPETFAAMREEMRRDGFSGGLDVVPFDDGSGVEKYLIVSGEWRWKAAVELGAKELPASHFRDERFKGREWQLAHSLRRNNRHGKHNKEKVRAVFMELVKTNPDADAVRESLGFTDKDAFNKLIGETRKTLEAQGANKDLLDKYDEQAANARSMADLSQIVSRLFDLYKDTVPFGFMVFTYGSKEHTYIAQSKEMKVAMDMLLSICQNGAIEINSVLAPVVKKLAKDLVVRTQGAQGDGPVDESF